MLSALSKYDEVNADFNCSYDLHHDVYVLKCQGHPFVYNLQTGSKCSCKELSGTEICSSCVEKRIVLNYDTKKYCFKKLPVFVAEDMVSFEQFLKDLKTDTIFWLYGNMVFCCLENYIYKEIIDNFSFNPGN